MLNVEGALRAYLQESLGVPAYVAVPARPPGAFVTVERTGGGDARTPVSENPTVVVDYWGPSRSAARALADAGDSAMLAAQGRVPGVARVDVNAACVHYPDETAGRERYESTYNLVTFEY